MTQSKAEGYEVFERLIGRRTLVAGPIFTTDAADLWEAYLIGLPADRRQHYNCKACKRFIEAYGGLVTIRPSGQHEPLFWDHREVPDFFMGSMARMEHSVRKARVTGVFYSEENYWGTEAAWDKKRGVIWTHICAPNPNVWRDRVLDAHQAMALKLEEHGMLTRALLDYTQRTVDEAVRVLKTDALTRSEKALGIAEWFAGTMRMNTGQLWTAVATAPAGFCHVRNTMVGTLLDDIVLGKSFEEVKAAWTKKMHPLQYQRPQAAPKAGAIEAAEQLVEKLGVAKSLERRFAFLAELPEEMFLWRARPSVEASGVFSHLKPKAEPGLAVQAGDITWAKFARTVLPTARRIEVFVPNEGPFYGLVGPVHRDAPVLFQWGTPWSWYFNHPTGHAHRWSLEGLRYYDAAAVLKSPADGLPNWGQMALFVIPGAHERRESGLALFPETLKSEFHGIRAVIEAHSASGHIQGRGDANGIATTKPITVRVDGTSYRIDRWD